MKNAWGLLLIVILALHSAGCGRVETVAPEDLIPLQTLSSYDPLFYVGSDSGYHYFRHLNVKIWEDYRVERDLLNMEDEFEVGSDRKAPVMWPGTLEKAMVDLSRRGFDAPPLSARAWVA